MTTKPPAASQGTPAAAEGAGRPGSASLAERIASPAVATATPIIGQRSVPPAIATAAGPATAPTPNMAFRRFRAGAALGANERATSRFSATSTRPNPSPPRPAPSSTQGQVGAQATTAAPAAMPADPASNGQRYPIRTSSGPAMAIVTKLPAKCSATV